MIAWVEGNTLLAGAIVLLVLFAAWLLWGRRKAPTPPREYRDVLSEGAGPAVRNTALIDAPPAAAIPPITPPPGAGLMAGVGEAVAHAAEQEVEQAASAPVPAPTPASVSSAEAADDLTRIKGVGPKLSATLKGLGVTSYAQIAAWDEADIARIDGQLGAFAGRAARDNWVEQCRLLAAGDVTGYEAKFGKL